MFVMDYYGHKLSNGVLFAHHLILDVPGGSSHLGYRRRVAICNNPGTRVKWQYIYMLRGVGCVTASEDRIGYSRIITLAIHRRNTQHRHGNGYFFQSAITIAAPLPLRITG